ncbi:MAG: hypothetical protein WCK05_13025 [Planctomycetota bacterium]
MNNFTGKIVASTSEPVNNAPVVVDIETDHGIETVAFQRQLWNAFVDDHADAISEANAGRAEFRVEVWGELWQRGIRCVPGCEFCPEEIPTDEEE